jgi:hypothetical protein
MTFRQSWALAHLFEVHYPLTTQFFHIGGTVTLKHSFSEFPVSIVAQLLVAQPVVR